MQPFEIASIVTTIAFGCVAVFFLFWAVAGY